MIQLLVDPAQQGDFLQNSPGLCELNSMPQGTGYLSTEVIALSTGDTGVNWHGTPGSEQRGSSTEEDLVGSWVGWVILLRRRLKKGQSCCLDDAVLKDGGLGDRSARARQAFFATLWCLLPCCGWRMLSVFGRFSFDAVRA